MCSGPRWRLTVTRPRPDWVFRGRGGSLTGRPGTWSVFRTQPPPSPRRQPVRGFTPAVSLKIFLLRRRRGVGSVGKSPLVARSVMAETFPRACVKNLVARPTAEIFCTGPALSTPRSRWSVWASLAHSTFREGERCPRPGGKSRCIPTARIFPQAGTDRHSRLTAKL